MRFIPLLLALLASQAALAQGSFMPRSMDREGTWDISLTLFDQGSVSVDGPEGTGLDIDSETGFGFGVAYNFDNRFSLGGDFLWVKPRFEGRFVDEDGEPFDISNKATFFTGQLRGTWHILPGDLTPYVEAGLGWTHIDSNVADGPPVTGCWWDPWWGYICRSFYSTYDDTSFSYSIGAGGRWDVNPQFGIRAGYSRQYVDFGSSTEDPDLDIWRVDFIFRN